MPSVNLHFPLLGERLPADHGYALYGSLSRILPALHTGDLPVLVGPVAGDYVGDGMLRLDSGRSFLRLRLPAEQIAAVLTLAEQSLEVDGHRVRIGLPRVLTLIPAPALIARMVTMKKSDRQDGARTRDYMEPGAFMDAVQREFQKRGIQGQAGIPLIERGPHEGKPQRQVLRIHDRKVVGFSLQVIGLSAEESVRLQEEGVGGRKKMGCGFFVPLRG